MSVESVTGQGVVTVERLNVSGSHRPCSLGKRFGIGGNDDVGTTDSRLKAEIRVQIDDPAAAIVALAKSKRCSEIVMGNSGHGRLAGLLLGSVAAKVIQLAPCPVTVVK